MVQSHLYDVRPGLRVFDVGGEQLGEVKEVREGAFKVNARFAPDYWIERQYVRSVQPGDRVVVEGSFRSANREYGQRYAAANSWYGDDDRFTERNRQRNDTSSRGYRGGMDYDPESDRWRRGPGYGPGVDYGDSFRWENEGAGPTRGESLGREGGRYWDYPQEDFERQGQYDRMRRPQPPGSRGYRDPQGYEPFAWGSGGEISGEQPYRPSGQQWGQQFRGYSGSLRDETSDDRAWWDEGAMSATSGPQAYGSGRTGAYSEREGQGQGFRGEHGGRGPKGYQRPDERVCEDVCEALTRHPDIDPSDIEVTVEGGEVRLSGYVETRHDKRLAEDVAAAISGVRDVRNELKTQTGEVYGWQEPQR